jgi:hypothetical protein
VRLTLRTLLAYLDDMLDPAETKRIGQKVAESDAAQELIARIKQVTRRRRLTTPPATGPNSFEPNTVAEYLDNTLPPEQVAEVEKACLESDVHLAEIAAAHQILTLVLGQPALVPPTAKQRMYLLAHGPKTGRARPEAVAATLPNGAAAAAPDADLHADEDETLLLGLPLRRNTALRWLLPVAAVLLLAILGFVFWDTFHFGDNRGTSVAAVNDSGRSPAPPEDTHKEQRSTEKEGTQAGPGDTNTTPNKPGGGGAGGTIGGTLGGGTEQPGDGPRPIVRPDAPSKDRREVARYVHRVGGSPSVLVTRASAQEPWQRVKPDAHLFTQDMLISLPGYKSEVRLESGVGLTLWGTTYEFRSPGFLESAVALHVPAKGLDADLTLDRGAILLTNQKDKPVTARVRFQGEVWDVTLEEPGSEVGVTLLGRHTLPYGSGEPPRYDGFLVVRKGRASVRVGPYVEHDNLEPVKEGKVTTPLVIFWDSITKGAQKPVPARDPKLLDLIAVFEPPLRRDLPEEVQVNIERTQAALDGLSTRLSAPGKIEALLFEAIQPGEVSLLQSVLSVRAEGALDAVGNLVNLLDDDQKPAQLRFEAIVTLRHWIGRNAGQEELLFDPKTKSGVLTDGGNLTPSEAAIVMELLHTPSQEQLESPAFWGYLIDKLKADKLAVRELAYFHLRRWVPEAQSPKYRYNPTDPAEARNAAFKQWKELIPDGKLPPTRPR